MISKEPAPNEYQEFLTEICARIFTARRSTARAVYAGLIALYWDLGRYIVETQARHSWGDRVLEMLANELARDFPNQGGLSACYLRYVRASWRTYGEDPFWQQIVAKLEANQSTGRPSAVTAISADAKSPADRVLDSFGGTQQ